MKKFIFAFASAILFSFSGNFVFAAKNNAVVTDYETQVREIDEYDYNTLLNSIKGVSHPFVKGDYLVFTAKNNAKFIGIAFDFENYKKVHNFYLHNTYSYEGEVTDSWYYFIVKKPKKAAQVSYKLVIDGLWTTDPNNSNTIFDEDEGMWLSQLIIPNDAPAITETLPSGLTHFVCFADPGQNIRIGGTFTNWDSWIYSMKEVVPGRYEIDIPLQQGTYYYAYYTGMKSFVDKTNPLKGYSSDGKVVSRINIE